MVFWATLLILQSASLVGSATGIPGVPENITVMFLNPTSVRVSWSTNKIEKVEKFDVTYKPTDARVVAVVAGNSKAVTLSNLRADTQYQLVVTAVKDGKKLRSRPIVFRTLEPPKTSIQQDSFGTTGTLSPSSPPSIQQPQSYIQIRGVEVGIVVLVLIVWVGAIALFFNRWGKIRMLLPYQPDYKEQLKVPGTGVCNSANPTYAHNTSQHACPQNLHRSNHHMGSVDSYGGGINYSKSNRPRVNSAIDVADFLSQEFLRRHGSTSRLCRKVRSADNLQNFDIQEYGSSDGDHETFLKTIRDDRENSDGTGTRNSSLENTNNDFALYKSNSFHHMSSSRHSTSIAVFGTSTFPEVESTQQSIMSTKSAKTTKHFDGWQNVIIKGRDCIRHPITLPASDEER